MAGPAARSHAVAAGLITETDLYAPEAVVMGVAVTHTDLVTEQRAVGVKIPVLVEVPTFGKASHRLHALAVVVVGAAVAAVVDVAAVVAAVSLKSVHAPRRHPQQTRTKARLRDLHPRHFASLWVIRM